MINRGDYSWWYRLSWDVERVALVIRVHPDMVRNWNAPALDSNWMRSYTENPSFPNFFPKASTRLEENFGFNDAFVSTVEVDGSVILVGAIPVVRHQTDQPCRYCSRHRPDKKRKCDCFDCQGTGFELLDDQRPAYALAASLLLFTDISPGVEDSVSDDWRQPQLIRLSLYLDKGFHGSSMAGTLSWALVRWLATKPANSSLPTVLAAMRAAHDRMLGREDYNEHEFRVRVGGGRLGSLTLDCPGSASGIQPADHDFAALEEGYEFACRNLDNPMQLLALVGGLAALSDLYHQENQPSP